jgi:hypothetical protein
MLHFIEHIILRRFYSCINPMPFLFPSFADCFASHGITFIPTENVKKK